MTLMNGTVGGTVTPEITILTTEVHKSKQYGYTIYTDFLANVI